MIQSVAGVRSASFKIHYLCFHDITVSKLHGVKNKRGNIRKRKVLYNAKRGYDAEKLAVNFAWTFLRW
jgi:hypothetical protein